MLANFTKKIFYLAIKNRIRIIFCVSFLFLPYVTFASPLSENHVCERSKSAADLLGWVPSCVCRKNLCGGYYLDPLAPLLYSPLPPLGTTPVSINSSQALVRQTGTSILKGNVTFTQPGRYVRADEARLFRNPDKNGTSTVTLQGNVVLRQPGRIVVGDEGTMELHSKAMSFVHAVYRLLISGFHPRRLSQTQLLNAWGKANKVEQAKTGIITLHNASYSTCAPIDPTWQMYAEEIRLDRESGRGTAHNVWLKFKKVPVLYTPYFNFPIDNRRQSGFLFPSVSNSSRSGFSVALPFYWNIEPNYDATLTPRYFTKRGWQFNGLFRYLTTTSIGSLEGSFLPNDRAFSMFQKQALYKYPPGPLLDQLENESSKRGYFIWKNETHFNPRWWSTINYHYISDSYYFEDFHEPITQVLNQFPRQATINYSGDIWNFTGELQSFQTLHPINQAPILNPYGHLPELDLNGNFPETSDGLHFQISNQFIYFSRQRNPEEIFLSPNSGPPAAGRLNIQPSVSLPITGMSGFLTPRLQLALTHYNISNQSPCYGSNINRALPIFDIDSGLYFDRDVTIGREDYQQTLEPRLFYLFVPYKNQNNIPLFDTALVPFSFDRLFLTNRFSGIDRIGDANQVSLALTTRFLDSETGAEKFHASIGQIYYFRDRLVNLYDHQGTSAEISSSCFCNNPWGVFYNNNNPIGVLGATSPTTSYSPIATQLSYYFNPHLDIVNDMSWDPHVKQMVNSTTYLHFQPTRNHIINLNYSFVRLGNIIQTIPATPLLSPKNDLNQAGFSFAWPIKTHWRAIGSWNYNLSRNYAQNYFYGLEYDSCCWAVRAIAGRMFTALNQNGSPIFNNGVYLQFQLKGLGTVGTSDPSSLLESSIPGYKDNFQPF